MPELDAMNPEMDPQQTAGTPDVEQIAKAQWPKLTCTS